jgi:hypothetical protein
LRWNHFLSPLPNQKWKNDFKVIEWYMYWHISYLCKSKTYSTTQQTGLHFDIQSSWVAALAYLAICSQWLCVEIKKKTPPILKKPQYKRYKGGEIPLIHTTFMMKSKGSFNMYHLPLVNQNQSKIQTSFFKLCYWLWSIYFVCPTKLQFWH